jgi:hypothetical protein
MRSRKGRINRYIPLPLLIIYLLTNSTEILMKRTLLLAILFVFAISSSIAREYKIASPDNKILLTVTVGNDIKWYATREGKEILSNSRIALILSN